MQRNDRMATDHGDVMEEKGKPTFFLGMRILSHTRNYGSRVMRKVANGDGLCLRQLTATRAFHSISAGTKSSFSQAIHFITEIKLQELEAQRLAYKEHAKVLDTAKTTVDIIKKVETLAKAIKSWTGSGAVKDDKFVGAKLQLDDLEFWLQQAKKDPSFSREIAERWADTLEQHIHHTATRFDAARLFGRLFNEWLASGDSTAIAYQGPSDEHDLQDTDTDGEGQSVFEKLGRKEMYEQKEKLTSIVFEDYPIEAEKLRSYLDKLFQSEETARALEKMRKELKDFSYWLQRKTISVVNVKNAIAGLLASGLMDEEKRTTLKAFQESDMVLTELASVLNMRMGNIKSWSWPKEGIPVEFRRHLNGKYRAFTDPEIVDAILLHHIGVVWQVKIKAALRRIFDSKAWERSAPPTGTDRDRWTEQLRGDTGGNSINAARNQTRRANFFMSQLQERSSDTSSYDDLVDAPEDGALNSPALIKRELLCIMTTECLLNQAIHDSHATVRSDLEWFGPSLPHTSILTVLEYMGMSKTWLGFFRAFLEAPIRFPGETEARVRKRGTPISYSLSVVCGEAVLFMMDFAVNQRANGLYLYRMHDDLWLWDADPKKVADGWDEMNKFAALVGLSFNKPKTGSAYVGPPHAATSRLPEGDIRWGFLKFQTEKGRFVIDQKDVDVHIGEMKRQLTSTKSVFGWVNAYNKYMAFFIKNFGGLPANCVAKEHVCDMIDTLARIQHELFADGGTIGYLRKTIMERFDTTDLPEGYFYFPLSSGGLDLQNSMLELLALDRRDKPLTLLEDEKSEGSEGKPEHSSSVSATVSDEDEEPDSSDYDDSDDESEPTDEGSEDIEIFNEDKAVADQKFKKRVDYDRKLYASMNEVWDLDTDGRRSKKGNLYKNVNFMSFNEYESLRETWLSGWGQSYNHMLRTPNLREISLMPEMLQLTAKWSGWNGPLGWYGKWVVNMYGEEVVRKFGGLELVDPNLIPIGMVELFKSSRMKLDQ